MFKLQIVKSEREVKIPREGGMELASSDYELSQDELNSGAIAETTWGIGLFGKPICHITENECKTPCYMIRWDTNIRDNEAYESIRSFLNQIRVDFGENYKRADFGKKYRTLDSKIDIGVKIGKKDKEEKLSLETFMDPESFKKQILLFKPSLVRIHSPYAHVGYATESGESVVPGVLENVLVASHLDLSDQLPSFIARTHKRKLDPEIVSSLRPELKDILGKCAKSESVSLN